MKNKSFLLVTAILISFGMGVICHKMFDADSEVLQQTQTTTNKYYEVSCIPIEGYYSDTQFAYIISDSGSKIQGYVSEYIDGQLVCSRIVDASSPSLPHWYNDLDTNVLFKFR